MPALVHHNACPLLYLSLAVTCPILCLSFAMPVKVPAKRQNPVLTAPPSNSSFLLVTLQVECLPNSQGCPVGHYETDVSLPKPGSTGSAVSACFPRKLFRNAEWADAKCLSAHSSSLLLPFCDVNSNCWAGLDCAVSAPCYGLPELETKKQGYTVQH